MIGTVDYISFGSTFIKELAVINHFNWKKQCWLFKPPFQENCLDSFSIQRNKAYKCYGHGLDWNDGYFNLKQLNTLLQEATSCFDLLLTVGSEKVAILENILQRPVINIYDLECPHINTLSPQLYSCTHHYKLDIDECALLNVIRIARWSNINNLDDHLDLYPSFKRLPMAA